MNPERLECESKLIEEKLKKISDIITPINFGNNFVEYFRHIYTVLMGETEVLNNLECLSIYNIFMHLLINKQEIVSTNTNDINSIKRNSVICLRVLSMPPAEYHYNCCC